MPEIDFSQPLRLGFTFSREAKKVHRLIRAFIKVGIPPEDIRPVDPEILEIWQSQGWEVSVYAVGSEEQHQKLVEWGCTPGMCHVLGPWKPEQEHSVPTL